MQDFWMEVPLQRVCAGHFCVRTATYSASPPHAGTQQSVSKEHVFIGTAKNTKNKFCI